MVPSGDAWLYCFHFNSIECGWKLAQITINIFNSKKGIGQERERKLLNNQCFGVSVLCFVSAGGNADLITLNQSEASI